MSLMAEVVSPKETLPVLFRASLISVSFNVPCFSAPGKSILAPGSWKLHLKIKRERPHLGTNEEKSFCRDRLICFTELNFSVTSL